ARLWSGARRVECGAAPHSGNRRRSAQKPTMLRGLLQQPPAFAGAAGWPGGRVAGAAGSGVVDQHPAHDLPVLEILVALVERVQCVRGGDQLVELELALVVQAQQLDDVVLRVGGAEQRSLDGLAEQG